MSEHAVLRRIWHQLGRTSVLFRTNTGKAWVTGGGPVRHLPDGSVLVPYGRPVSLGFGLINGDPVKGASDLNGWTSVTITPDMVGRRIAVFTAIEVKRSEGGRTSAEQRHYCDRVRRAGGISGIVSSPEAAVQLCGDWLKNRS